MQRFDTQPRLFTVAIILSMVCLSWHSLDAQVIIKDTVVISSGQRVWTEGGSLSPTVDDIFFRAPRSGVLAIMPSFVAKVRTPLPASAYLAIQLSDTTYTPEVLPFLPNHVILPAEHQDSCGRSFDTTEYRYCATSPCQFFAQSAFDTFYTRWLQEGDTVRFSLHADYINPTISIDNPSNNRWEVSLLAEFCTAYYPEQCYLSFFFADTLVKFKRPDSINVYPTYPSHNDTLGKKNYMDLELRVEFADSAIPDYWVRVDTPGVVDSGGHSHSHTSPRRPVGRYIHPIVSTDTTDTLLAQTDDTGKLRFRYVASKFGGVERITARLVTDTTTFDTLSLVTRVSGLVSLPADTNYFKTGGTDEHHGPPGFTDDNNHWLTPVARDSLISGAVAFRNARWNRQGDKMKINDVSLPKGGGFDIGGRWAADVDPVVCRLNLRGHCSHREGTDVDIENRGRLAELVDVLEKRGWDFIPEGPSTFPHFRFE